MTWELNKYKISSKKEKIFPSVLHVSPPPHLCSISPLRSGTPPVSLRHVAWDPYSNGHSFLWSWANSRPAVLRPPAPMPLFLPPLLPPHSFSGPETPFPDTKLWNPPAVVVVLFSQQVVCFPVILLNLFLFLILQLVRAFRSKVAYNLSRCFTVSQDFCILSFFT